MTMRKWLWLTFRALARIPQLSQSHFLTATDRRLEGHCGRRALLYFGDVRQGVRQWVAMPVWQYAQLTIAACSRSRSQDNKCSRAPWEVVPVPERQAADLGRYRCQG
jgi:hypothetical protein